MKIAQVELEIRHIPLTKAFRTSLREAREIKEIIVHLHTADHHHGRGAACSSAKVTGECLGGIRQVIEDKLFPSIQGMHVADLERIMEQMHNCVVGNYSAKAAMDMAIYDLWAQYNQRPLYKLLGGYRHTIITDITLSMDSPEKMAQEAKRAVEQGFTTLKIKMGQSSEEDIARMAQIRQAVGNSIELRVDANQGWSPKQALTIINALQPYRPEFIEQPVAATDLHGLKWLRDQVAIPIMADESLFSARDAWNLLAVQCVDLLNIKLLKCGGIHSALKIVAVAEAAGVECMLGCMLESPISILPALHLAAAKKNITRVDLDSLFFIDFKNESLPNIQYGPQTIFT